MKQKTATVIGATGLIGGHIIDLLQRNSDYTEIRVVTRRPVEFFSPLIRQIVIDFSDLRAFREALAGSDAVFCAVGTTNSKVKGDKDAYRKVDYEIPVNAARICLETGCPRFLLVSSVGAAGDSKNFYLRLKGEVEDVLKSLDIHFISVFRPSMLLGRRKEKRTAENMAQALMKPLSFLFPEKYKPIQAENVAKAMIAASVKDIPGFSIYHHDQIMDLAASLN